MIPKLLFSTIPCITTAGVEPERQICPVVVSNHLLRKFSSPLNLASRHCWMQGMYQRAREYLELDARIEVLNTRLSVLQDFLDMSRDTLSNEHMARLEWIVIWLVAVCVVMGVLEVLEMMGMFGKGRWPP